MYAVEFEADAKNGIVQIPSEFRELSDQHLKIIALLPSKPKAKKAAPHPKLKGALVIKGDIVSPVLTQEEWGALA